MAKSAKRKAPFAAAVRNVSKPAAPNPFEKGNGKQKFNIVGRKNLSATKNISKARSEAVDKRKKTLLVEYKQLKKSNAFVDRRIGEYDEQLTEEEKAIARFQRERLQRARKSKFTLPEAEGGEAEGLTHLGNPLSTLDDLKDAVPDADGEGEDDEGGYEVGDARVVAAAHFGGGPEEGRDRRSKKEVMAEVMAVSKAARAEKRMQKQGDEELLGAVDERFASLFKTKQWEAIWRTPGERHSAPAAAADDSAYEQARVAAAGSARARAGDREPTQAEREAQAQQEREAAEAAASAAAAGEDEDTGLPAGGYAARRARAELERRKQEAAERRDGGAEAEDDFDLGSSGGEEGGMMRGATTRGGPERRIWWGPRQCGAGSVLRGMTRCRWACAR
eukprot:jgi/Ulvmu1/2178/UM013_0023.1